MNLTTCSRQLLALPESVARIVVQHLWQLLQVRQLQVESPVSDCNSICFPDFPMANYDRKERKNEGEEQTKEGERTRRID